MKNPRLEIICIGTELLTGKISTHTARIGVTLGQFGFHLSQEHTVGDDPALMKDVFRTAWAKSDVVICSGGLGPTFDDITRDIWAEVIHRPLQLEPRLLREIKRKFLQRNIPMPPLNKRQAYLLKGAAAIDNPNGTAPGQWVEINKKLLILLPGPSREILPMFDETVIPLLLEKFQSAHTFQKQILCFGTPESKIDALIRPWVKKRNSLLGLEVIHGILASNSIISVKFTVRGKNSGKVLDAAKILTAELRSILRNYSFGEDNDSLESVVARLLSENKQTLAVAESCTGGLLSKTITDLPGASNFFIEGMVTYHNQSKQNRLKVSPGLLKKYGAVSTQTAAAMAVGLKKSAQTDHAISITGIAGPAGATPSKPVGLVYIGYAGPKNTLVKKFQFNGDRAWIRHRASLMALDLLRKQLRGRRKIKWQRNTPNIS